MAINFIDVSMCYPLAMVNSGPPRRKKHVYGRNLTATGNVSIFIAPQANRLIHVHGIDIATIIIILVYFVML